MRLFVLGCILLASANSEPPKQKKLQPAVECEYNGKKFKPGDLVTGDKCDPCFCSSFGAVYCALRQCPPVMCVDAAVPVGECCPICSNGPNCYLYSNRTIIPGGSVYSLTDFIECECVPNSMWASCRPKMGNNFPQPIL